MKILTLNTHSLQEDNYEQKLHWFVEGILKEKPDIIAMQEVNQSLDALEIPAEELEGQFPVPGCVCVRRDNHAARVAWMLQEAGVDCSWSWLPVKLGYGKYDEGVAILSLGRPIRNIDQFPVSRVHDYNNWRTRAVLGVQLEGMDDWFYTVHMGWWDDTAERFLDQWKRLNSCIASKRMCGQVWLIGDFNAPDQVPGQSYDYITACGWRDTYKMGAEGSSGITVPGVIDGWREKIKEKDAAGMRLDYIWCSRKQQIRSARVMFDGSREPVVSDHFGVLVEAMEMAS